MNKRRILYGLMAIAFLSFLNTVTYQDDALAQNSGTSPTSPDWFQILISGITAAIFSAGISALVNYKVTLKQIQGNYNTAMDQLKVNHENTMKQLEANYIRTMEQLKQERQVEVIRDKLNFYSFFLYQLKKVMSSVTFQAGGEDIGKITNTFNEIDSMLKKNSICSTPKL
jgi:hypothetical protein